MHGSYSSSYAAAGTAGTEPTAAPQHQDYIQEHDADGSATLHESLVHALADVMGRDVRTVESIIDRQINADALSWLFRTDTPRSGPPAHVAFSAHRYGVTVWSDGRIVITPPVSDRARRRRQQGGRWPSI